MNFGKPSRRTFLKVTGLAAGGFAIGLTLPGRLDAASLGETFAPNAWIRIDATGVTILVGQSEMGQGVFTALPMLLAAAVDWARTSGAIRCLVALSTEDTDKQERFEELGFTVTAERVAFEMEDRMVEGRVMARSI